MPINLERWDDIDREAIARNLSKAIDRELERNFGIRLMSSEIRDLVVVVLGQILLAMEMNKDMTVGKAADSLLAALDKAGYEVKKK